MNVFIRTDASAALGGGHLMRCLTLADELRQRGHSSVVITRSAMSPWGDAIAAAGHATTPLPPEFHDWEQDARETTVALSRSADCDLLIVDHYQLGAEWEGAMRPHVGRIMAIDDLHRRHDCDILLDQNVIDDTRYPLIPLHCTQLLGPRYALLRPQFRNARALGLRHEGTCRHILANFGSSDPTAESGKAIEAFLKAGLADARLQVVLGGGNACREELHAKYDGHPLIELIDHSEQMAELMAGADLAVGAGGISTWERASLGLPSIVVAVAPNQEAIAAELARRGTHCYLGRAADVSVTGLRDALRFVAHNGFLRELLGAASARLCDGEGARRVADCLQAASIELRRALPGDAGALHEWRNAEEVRRFSSNTAPIARSDHEKWLARTLASPDRHLLIGEDKLGPVGVVRFDISGDCAEISIYLVPARMGSRRGTALLAAAHRWLAQHLPEVHEVRARVAAQNPRSAMLFEHAGYRLDVCGYRKKLEARKEVA